MKNKIHSLYKTTSDFLVKIPALKFVLDRMNIVNPFIKKENIFSLSAADFIYAQHKDGVFIRPDLIIRYMFIEQHYGADVGIDAVALYKKMQDYRLVRITGEEAITKFYKLIRSYEENGYNPNHPVEVDKNLLIRDGSHRTALALYFGVPEITVHVSDVNLDVEKKMAMYEGNGFTEEERKLIENKINQVLDKYNQPLNIILWDSATAYADNIAEILGEYGIINSVSHYSLISKNYIKVLKKIIKIKNIKTSDIRIKGKNGNIAVINMKLNKPTYKEFKDVKEPVIAQISEIIKTLKNNKDFQVGECDEFLTIPLNFRENMEIENILSYSLKRKIQ